MRDVIIVGNSPEEREKAFEDLRKQGYKTLDGGYTGVPLGTHLFTVAETNIYGTKIVDNSTGHFEFPTVAGVIIVSTTGENFRFDNSEDSKKLVIARKFHWLIKPNARLYITIEANNAGWKNVTKVETA